MKHIKYTLYFLILECLAILLFLIKCLYYFIKSIEDNCPSLVEDVTTIFNNYRKKLKWKKKNILVKNW